MGYLQLPIENVCLTKTVESFFLRLRVITKVESDIEIYSKAIAIDSENI